MGLNPPGRSPFLAAAASTAADGKPYHVEWPRQYGHYCSADALEWRGTPMGTRDGRNILANFVGPLTGSAVERRKGKSPSRARFLDRSRKAPPRATVNVAATFVAGYVLKKLFDKTVAVPAETEAPAKPARPRRKR